MPAYYDMFSPAGRLAVQREAILRGRRFFEALIANGGYPLMTADVWQWAERKALQFARECQHTTNELRSLIEVFKHAWVSGYDLAMQAYQERIGVAV